jgi:hypothetical protein
VCGRVIEAEDLTVVSQAHNFAWAIKRQWEDGDGERNAIVRAERYGAKPVARVYSHDHWEVHPHDSPARLYQFLDGSQYVVGETGHWVAPALKKGNQRAKNYEVFEVLAASPNHA